ncbi:MAG: hypothetical protein K0V04_29475, partial [Deltaproteobacteria bacterium]|nr:hypothetical protein [Deltaproteobacteria bacterium]
MASSKVRPTPPPRGPALVPAVGALIVSLCGVACSDDDSLGLSADTGNSTEALPTGDLDDSTGDDAAMEIGDA